MILVGLGANLIYKNFQSPSENLILAIDELYHKGISVCKRSKIYKSSPVPLSHQPLYYNAVIEVKCNLDPRELLNILHEVELSLGRIRKEKWSERVIDLDLLSYNDFIISNSIKIPHPRMHERSFVLRPMSDIAPFWTHPIIKKSISDLNMCLNDGQIIAPLSDEGYPKNWNF
ncbi:2-amino-4-hydroxy-6-hydroxymethyldihydropteridine diphosphokinase [Alphaproteobacteria bacterium]|nr:2-amino-4-hydroxy-6-hydroxymethyldihydropteridine diphosphokinase [Alphaproteobacteria bacterium]